MGWERMQPGCYSNRGWARLCEKKYVLWWQNQMRLGGVVWWMGGGGLGWRGRVRGAAGWCGGRWGESPQGLTDRSRLKRLRGWMCAHVQGGLSSMSSPSPLTSLHLSCYSAQAHVWQMGEGKPSIIVIICFYPALSAWFPFFVPCMSLDIFFYIFSSPSALMRLSLCRFPLPLSFPTLLLTFTFFKRLVPHSRFTTIMPVGVPHLHAQVHTHSHSCLAAGMT